tara:strand:+ start:172 stop:867 length:696 start_codon:yes stop_codon:yes gene_type:complete
MKSKLNNFLIIIFLFIFTPIQAKNLTASYKLEIGALNLGKLEWNVEISDSNYKTTMQLNDMGVFSGLYKFSGEYYAQGKIINNSFVSSKYLQIWKTKKKIREVEIFFKNTSVFSLLQKPTETELSRVDYLNIPGFVDPLSSFLNILINGQNNFTTIDGRRLYKMETKLENEKPDIVTKKILIDDYVNIWADHKRKDLKFIIIKQDKKNNDVFFPRSIIIKNKGLVFSLTKI